MSTRDFHDILNDCIERMASGQSLEACLRLYPDEAERLRPLLAAGVQMRHLLAEPVEIHTDQTLVWGRIELQIAQRYSHRPRRLSIGRLLLAAALLLGLLGGAWLALNRPQQEPNLIEPLPTTVTPTHTASPSATFSPTPTLTPTPSPAPSSTPFPTVLPPSAPPPATQVDDNGADDDSPDDDGEHSGSDDDSDDD